MTKVRGATGSRNEGNQVSLKEIDEISTITEPVLRNLRITQAYHDLAISMAQLLGQENVSWCAFGTWASRTAGRSIRGESAPAIIRTAIAFSQRIPPQFRRIRTDTFTDAVEQVSNNVAWGNLLVFRDLGPLFVSLIDNLGQASGADQAEQRCIASLTPGPVKEGGQDLLISAARNYFKAQLAQDAGERAEHVLLANLYIGLHEQIRLQAPITQALAWPTDTRISYLPLLKQLQRSWETMVTQQLMDLRLPASDFGITRRLISQRIGADIGKTSKYAQFPEALAHLKNIELKALLYDIDRTPNTLLGSAAENWTALGDRMNFVADLFRVWQQEQRLLQPPFTAAQTATLRTGRVPIGPQL
ncbi:hypothetical protein [Streptomyces sp. NPDC101150]|uniref:hypothetical protein n=1 Tax=Streptomyces sp. NPDC101150 TaxID=3366114 RepID=UPI00380EFB6B